MMVWRLCPGGGRPIHEYDWLATTGATTRIGRCPDCWHWVRVTTDTRGWYLTHAHQREVPAEEGTRESDEAIIADVRQAVERVWPKEDG